jgi:indolepyruvate ferredoxin oxidoreductase beta subunit
MKASGGEPQKMKIDMKEKNILLVGVGGQGTILAAKILSDAALAADFDVKMSEIHGMSQRGGSVSTQVRFGEKIFSPVIAKGTADLLVSFEKMEALRYLPYIKDGGTIIVNDYEIPSLPILTGAADYPENIIKELQKGAETVVVPAFKIAKKLGNPKVMNLVLLGHAAKTLNLPDLDFAAAIKKNVPEKFLELNMSAFNDA